MDDLDKRIDGIIPNVVEWRHDLHAHPCVLVAAMADVAYGLSEEEITALAHYLAHL